MYLFQVLLLLHWISEFSPELTIIMYFGHRSPLTSHIRGHLSYTWMAPLRPSADIPHVGTQKDIYGLRLPVFIIPWLMMKYIVYMPSWLLFHLNILSRMRDYPYWHLVHHARVLCSASRIYLYARVAFVWSRVSCAGFSTTDPHGFLKINI